MEFDHAQFLILGKTGHKVLELISKNMENFSAVFELHDFENFSFLWVCFLANLLDFEVRHMLKGSITGHPVGKRFSYNNRL